MPSVSELVAKFEKWESREAGREDKKKHLSTESVTQLQVCANETPQEPTTEAEALDGATPLLSSPSSVEKIVTPRGRVKYLRDRLEQQCKTKSCTLIPTKKTSQLRRVPTTYYNSKEAEGDSDVPYCHLNAYFDEVTNAYWAIIDNNILVYDELGQQFVEPSPSLTVPRLNVLSATSPDQVSPPCQKLEDVQEASEVSEPSEHVYRHVEPQPESTMKTETETKTESEPVVPEKPTTPDIPDPPKYTPDTPRLPFIPQIETPRTPILSNSTEPLTPRTRMEQLTKDLQRVSIRTGVSVTLLRKFHMGVQVYALVKSNGGMLKPVILHLAADRGKIYIVRQGKSRYLTIQHFSECDSRDTCIDFMKKASAGAVINDTINSLRQQPLMVLWTSSEFTAENKCGSNLDHKGMAFVFDSKLCRDDYVATLKAVAEMFKHPLKIKV